MPPLISQRAKMAARTSTSAEEPLSKAELERRAAKAQKDIDAGRPTRAPE